tara:strand:- start:7346 stop:7495 length:150 start_codon:yes stop_codon:yes gene_type:complete
MANYQSPDQMQKSPKKSAVYGYVQERTPLVLNIQEYLKDALTPKRKKKE